MDPPDHPMGDAYASGSEEEEDWELQAALQASMAEASPAGALGTSAGHGCLPAGCHCRWRIGGAADRLHI